MSPQFLTLCPGFEQDCLSLQPGAHNRLVGRGLKSTEPSERCEPITRLEKYSKDISDLHILGKIFASKLTRVATLKRVT